jgi:hypothetical protein
MALNIGIGTTTPNFNDQQTAALNSALGLISGDPRDPNNMINHLVSDKELKLKQQSDLQNLLLLTDLNIDGYDQMIINIDKKLPALINPINTASLNLATAYQSRIAAGCLSDLTWTLTQEIQRTGIITSTGNSGTIRYQYWEVTRDPSQFVQLNYYAAKYYRRPRNMDYGATSSREIQNGSVGINSTSLIVFDSEGSTNISVGNIITDDMESPYIFEAKNLPTIIGIGTTVTLGIVTSFIGTVSSGTTILRQVGSGIVTGLTVGQYINRTAVTDVDTTVVGLGTTTASITIIDLNGNTSISTSTVNTVILSKPAIASTSNATFTASGIGTYTVLGLSTAAVRAGVNTNFFVIQNTPLDPLLFDFSKSSSSPIQIGLIKSSLQYGYGHTLTLVNNGITTESKSWDDNVELEPAVGAGFTGYYTGAALWPTITLSGLTTYAPLGTKVTIALGPNESQSTTGTTSVGIITITPSACSVYTSGITSAQTTYNNLVTTNVPEIQRYIGISSVIRSMRDNKEVVAWGLQRSLGSAGVEAAKATQNLEFMQGIDFTEFT